MKTIEEKAEEYAKNKIKGYNDYFIQPQFSNAKTDFAAGYNAANYLRVSMKFRPLKPHQTHNTCYKQ